MKTESGSVSDFDALVAAHRDELFGHCYRMLGSVQDAEDALQEALLAAWRERVPSISQQAELQSLGDQEQRELVDAFVAAWERADVAGLIDLLVEDARFRMPPLPAWFSGREDISRFLGERMFATPWRLVRIGANAQLAFACYQGLADGFRLGAINQQPHRPVHAAAGQQPPVPTQRHVPHRAAIALTCISRCDRSS